ncbi:hypothetical protein DRQ36_02990 [bacterium]|nr:MAG: hypothetical protein DRQ36_02990 [bacterium]
MAKRLSKEIGLLGVFAICTGAMISSGFFLLPGIAASKAGPAVILAYILSGLLIIPTLFSMSELSTAMPRSGGTYFFISRSLGPMFGTIDGVGVWLAMLLKSSIALVGLGAYLAHYVGLPQVIIGVIFGVVFMAINLIGTKETGGLQVGMVVALLGILIYFLVAGLPRIEPANLKPFTPFGTGAILPTAGFVFVSYIGLTKVASVSEEVRNPGRNIPLGMILSLVVVITIYALGVWVVVGVLPAEELYFSLTPIADAAGVIVGPVGVILITIAAVLAFATTGNAGIMSASRYLLAMGRDRVIPHPFSRLSRFRTPKNAILLTSGIVLLIVLTLNVESIAKLASTFQILVFAFINIAVIVMRESGIKSYDPGFKSPLYPYIQIAGILVAVILIPEMGLIASIFALVLVSLGVVWYYLYVRRRVTSTAAIGKMAERAAERLLARDAHALGLDKELRQILKEKGLRREDPFERVVREAEFLELECGCEAEEVLHRASRILAKRSGMSTDLLYGALLERSRLGETPAEAGIALPHVLMNDVEDFYLVMARSIDGIEFPMSEQSIHAVFVLLGSRKNPAQHLRFLAEIARRAEDPAFLDLWINAKGRAEIIEVLLTKET